MVVGRSLRLPKPRKRRVKSMSVEAETDSHPQRRTVWSIVAAIGGAIVGGGFLTLFILVVFFPPIIDHGVTSCTIRSVTKVETLGQTTEIATFRARCEGNAQDVTPAHNEITFADDLVRQLIVPGTQLQCQWTERFDPNLEAHRYTDCK